MTRNFLKAGLAALSLVVAVAVIYWRRPDAFYNPQFWAEDGPIFFAGAYYHGPGSLFMTHAGYHHLFPRFIALLCESLPIPYQYFPLLYNLAWLSVLGITVALIWRITRIPLSMKFLFTVLLVSVPVGFEVFINLTNTQWIMAIMIMFYALNPPSRNAAVNWLLYVWLFICGLTTPLSIVYPVLFMISYTYAVTLADRRHQRINLGSISLAGFIQFIALLKGSERLQNESVNWFDPRFFQYIKDQYLYIFTGNTTWLENPAHTFLVSVPALALLGWLLMICIRRKDPVGLILFAGGLLTLFAILFELRHFHTSTHPYFASLRYYYIPSYSLVVSLMWILHKPRPAYRIAQVIILAWITIITFTTFKSLILPDKNWSFYARQIQENKTVTVPLNPVSWKIDIRPEEKWNAKK